MGIGALLIGGPVAYAMLGCCWLGAAMGRLTSLILDGKSQKKWLYFVIEAVVGTAAVAANTAAFT